MSSSDPDGQVASVTVLPDMEATAVGEAAEPLSLEVRDLDNTIVARGITGSTLQITPGRYLVTARDTLGRRFVSRDLLVAESGSYAEIHLHSVAESAVAPGILESMAEAPVRQTAARALTGDAAEGAPPAPGTGEPLHLWHTGDPLLDLLGGVRLPRGPSPDALAGFGRVERRFTSEGTVEIALPPLPDIPRSYRAVIPVDRTGPTLLRFREAPPRHPDNQMAYPQRFVLEVELAFEDRRLQRFWMAVCRAAFREAWAKSEAMAPELQQSGADWMREKLESPVGAVLGAYVLLRANRLDRLDRWSANLAEWFPNSADARVIRAEVLSRFGLHAEAARHLAELVTLGCPWLRPGVQYGWRLASGYAAARDEVELREVGDATMERVETLQRVLGRLNGNSDPTYLNTVIHWHFPERRIAR